MKRRLREVNRGKAKNVRKLEENREVCCRKYQYRTQICKKERGDEEIVYEIPIEQKSRRRKVEYGEKNGTESRSAKVKCTKMY